MPGTIVRGPATLSRPLSEFRFDQAVEVAARVLGAQRGCLSQPLQDEAVGEGGEAHREAVQVLGAELPFGDASFGQLQTRTGLAALELDPTGPYAGPLLDAVADVARLDAYAAREVLHHPATRTAPSADRDDALNAVITAAGLGAGVLPGGHRQSPPDAVAVAVALALALALGARQSPGGGTATHMSDRTQRHGTPRSATQGEGPVFEIGF